MQTYAYGFPRIGKHREYKTTLESFWNDTITAEEFYSQLLDIDADRCKQYARVDHFPRGEMTLFDPILDMAYMLGVYSFQDCRSYYEHCRGKNALPLKKYFNTNYHYLQPTLKKAEFAFSWDKIRFFKAEDSPLISLPGPYTFLSLCETEASIETYAEAVADAYAEIFTAYPHATFHIEEPGLCTDMSPKEEVAFSRIYTRLTPFLSRLHLITYYERPNKIVYTFPFKALGIDFIRGHEAVAHLSKIPEETTLIAGVSDSLHVWKSDTHREGSLMQRIRASYTGTILLSNAAPLFHLPYSLSGEDNPVILQECAFACEKMDELSTLWNKAETSAGQHKNTSLNTVEELHSSPRNRSPYTERKKKQVQLPLFPTTTIGSFPQDREVRRMRAQYRKGTLSPAEYKNFIAQKIENTIQFQEEIGLDVLVHGEFERSDMVEFFAENMEGILQTKQGWIISYGSRGYRPPLIAGKIQRKNNAPMTVAEVSYAQGCTEKPVKGMLTGPATILAWSFVSPHISSATAAMEIGQALKDEIEDYKKAGIQIVQVDEPAFKEGAPLRKEKEEAYYLWATEAFRRATDVSDTIQIHTHMCYSDFVGIMPWIDALDADVISVEATRAGFQILDAFRAYGYTREVGIGLWDIHSKEAPEAEALEKNLTAIEENIPVEQIWINPDCGLKTRKQEEIKLPLQRLTALADRCRKDAQNSHQR
ncbi:5-methyltetrahydropteroyltriglutamate--homocysteine S-methyltransferase [Chitinivibrio alkaliphilus]|uniref:5-methyltetrahydropteroyltriglutamate--homocysteine S-methyltransferase n=1 Tax=Chitinivibrio alkaliphilus ACht1 TaxID=1313304 RepID=U7D5C8_9BACT|nr:5-methyltetrahydropteroyltriglutamate--homocysteine S-methyltransferase [Chitinivibrio alkaliphilus]ERP31153.1 5-methyltetrahydropteroyltriglutamate-homocysteine S-methyltransferase [Chitinivibrio alkaliphilus ACht1]